MKIKPALCWCVYCEDEPLICSCRWKRGDALQAFLDSGQKFGKNVSVRRVTVRVAPRSKRKSKRGVL